MIYQLIATAAAIAAAVTFNVQLLSEGQLIYKGRY